MHLGMIGLGRMGASLTERLTKDGHHCVVYDVNPEAIKKVSGHDKVEGAQSINDLMAANRAFRVLAVLPRLVSS